MVKGRAVRKGLCEECAEGRAVLQCSECQECTQFCPQCWVHVHSTRRRKAHIPIPMVAEAKVAASGRKNLPEIQYPTHHSPNKAAHKCAEAIQHLDYTSVSGFGQIKNSATSASLQGDRLSTIEYSFYVILLQKLLYLIFIYTMEQTGTISYTCCGKPYI